MLEGNRLLGPLAGHTSYIFYLEVVQGGSPLLNSPPDVTLAIVVTKIGFSQWNHCSWASAMSP